MDLLYMLWLMDLLCRLMDLLYRSMWCFRRRRQHCCCAVVSDFVGHDFQFFRKECKFSLASALIHLCHQPTVKGL